MYAVPRRGEMCPENELIFTVSLHMERTASAQRCVVGPIRAVVREDVSGQVLC